MITDAICAVPISLGAVARLCLIDAVSEVEVGSSFCYIVLFLILVLSIRITNTYY